MTSQAVFNWDRNTLEGVHNMMELVLHFVCKYMSVLKQFCVENQNEINLNYVYDEINDVKQTTLLDLLNCNNYFFKEVFKILSIIFDCETSYHQSCRDRKSSVENYE